MSRAVDPVILRHNRVDLALHHLRDAVEDDVQALLCCTAWASAPRRRRRPGPTAGRARSGASTSPATGRRPVRAAVATRPRSSWPTPPSPPSTWARPRWSGRGLGAYLALLVAGARPDARAGRGAARRSRPGRRRSGPGLAHDGRRRRPPGRPARPLRPGRDDPRRPAAGLRPLLGPPGGRGLRARHPAGRRRPGPPALAGGRGRLPPASPTSPSTTRWRCTPPPEGVGRDRRSRHTVPPLPLAASNRRTSTRRRRVAAPHHEAQAPRAPAPPDRRRGGGRPAR